MVNRYRGEIALEIEGTSHTLCLTLGALAELEALTGTTSLGDLVASLSKPSTKLMIGVLIEGLKAGSALDQEAAGRLVSSSLTPGDLVRTYNALIRATFLDA